MYKDQSTIFFREKKSKNTLLLRKLERNKEQFTYHSTLGLRENNFWERNMILSDFWDFFIGEKEVIHTTSGVKIYVWFDAQIIEGPRGMTALISAHGTKAVLVSPSWKILRNLGEGNTENLLYNARVQKKRESLAFIEKIEYSRDTGKLVVYYGKYFLYRESDFSDDWEKQEFRRVRKSFKKEERWVTYSVLSNGVLEEIQL